MAEWRKCKKKPIIVEFREPNPENNEKLWGFKTIPKDREICDTLEGRLYAIVGRDYIMRGINGETYPINKKIFEQTYEIVGE